MIIHYSMWDQIKVSSHSDNQVCEYLNFLQDDVFINPVKVKDGRYIAPKSYGWGLEMKDSFFDGPFSFSFKLSSLPIKFFFQLMNLSKPDSTTEKSGLKSNPHAPQFFSNLKDIRALDPYHFKLKSFA